MFYDQKKTNLRYYWFAGELLTGPSTRSTCALSRFLPEINSQLWRKCSRADGVSKWYCGGKITRTEQNFAIETVSAINNLPSIGLRHQQSLGVMSPLLALRRPPSFANELFVGLSWWLHWSYQSKARQGIAQNYLLWCCAYSKQGYGFHYRSCLIKTVNLYHVIEYHYTVAT